jgi:hypothetical protein
VIGMTCFSIFTVGLAASAMTASPAQESCGY